MNNYFSCSRYFPKIQIHNIAVFSYFDLLFFPYIQLIIIPLSLPLVVFGILFAKKKVFPPDTKMFLGILAFFMITSMGVGFFLPNSSPYFIENIKRLGQFFTSFLYLAFFFFIALQYRIEKPLRVISLVFLVYFSALLIWFFFKPSLVNDFMGDFYGRLVTTKDIVLTHFRFAYLFNDPNTAGYLLLIAVLPWLTLYKNMVNKVIVVSLCVICSVFIQSRGVLLSLILAILLWVFPWRWLIFRFRVRDIFHILKLSIVVALIAFIAIFLITEYFGGNNILDMSLQRITDRESYRQGDSRFNIWEEYATTLIPFPIGSGYMFDTVNGQFFPHSDLLRLIYSYGFIAAGLFVWWFFRKGWNYPLILMPALMAFSINSLIDEQKLFGLFLATLGVLLGMHQREHAFGQSNAACN